jgi:hypothetical protein
LTLRFLLLALVGTVLSPSTPSPTSQSVAPYQITDVRVQLFYSREGTFSGNLVGTPNMNSLWNTVIGAGQGGGASSATLVVVEVSGQPNSYAGKSSVDLAVRGEKKEVLHRRQRLDVLSGKGKGYIGFWLYDTGCEPLRVSAKLVGKTKSSPVNVEIPFRCGE